jgi:transposase
MDREWLEAQLGEGRSIESIAREVGRHPSTVAYWVSKHGLRSQHVDRHAARGGLERDLLSSLVAQGLSERAIADRVGVSQASVRHWLLKHGLETARASRLRASRADPARPDATGRLVSICPVHGETVFVARRGGGFRCRKCRASAVVKRRRSVKAALVAEAGGCCVRCGYDRSLAALQFHHLDPTQKEFSVAHRGVTRSLEAARVEARKCVLLCANCHAEVEAGDATLAAVAGR